MVLIGVMSLGKSGHATEQAYLSAHVRVTPGVSKPLGVDVRYSYRWGFVQAGLPSEIGVYGQMGWSQWRGFDVSLGPEFGFMGVYVANEFRHAPLWQLDAGVGPALVFGWGSTTAADTSERVQLGVSAQLGVAYMLRPGFAHPRLNVEALFRRSHIPRPTLEPGLSWDLLGVFFTLDPM